jgi:hypothetical protein
VRGVHGGRRNCLCELGSVKKRVHPRVWSVVDACCEERASGGEELKR